MGITIASSCNSALNEAEKVGKTTFKLLQDIPEFKMTENEEMLREELLVLAQQALMNCPHFTAAGFFNVDYTMLYNILGSVTSYVVVIVQFNK